MMVKKFKVLGVFDACVARMAEMIPVAAVKPCPEAGTVEVAFRPFVFPGFTRAAFVAYCEERGVGIAMMEPAKVSPPVGVAETN